MRPWALRSVHEINLSQKPDTNSLPDSSHFCQQNNHWFSENRHLRFLWDQSTLNDAANIVLPIRQFNDSWVNDENRSRSKSCPLSEVCMTMMTRSMNRQERLKNVRRKDWEIEDLVSVGFRGIGELTDSTGRSITRGCTERISTFVSYRA